jgi:hypothetical protein
LALHHGFAKKVLTEMNAAETGAGPYLVEPVFQIIFEKAASEFAGAGPLLFLAVSRAGDHALALVWSFQAPAAHQRVLRSRSSAG